MSATSIIERSVFLKMKPQAQDPLDDEVSTSAGGSDNSGDEQPPPSSSVMRSNLKVAPATPCTDAYISKKKQGFMAELISRFFGICVFFSTLIFGPLFSVPTPGRAQRCVEKPRGRQAGMPSRAGDVTKSSTRRVVKGGDVKSSGGAQKRSGGQRLKTQLCIHFAKGYCKNGEFCTWAHGDEEIGTPQPDKETIEMVSKSSKTNDAKFVKPQQQQMQKKKLCTFFTSSFCSRGELCTYAHGEEELGTYHLFMAAPPKQAPAADRVASGGRPERPCSPLSAPPPPDMLLTPSPNARERRAESRRSQATATRIEAVGTSATVASQAAHATVELLEFDQTRYRKELTAVMRDLANGQNVAACIQRIRAQNVPEDRQAAEFSDILTRAAEENQNVARRLSFAFAVGLATGEPTSAFDRFECEKGLELFFEDGFDDLATEVPRLRSKIANELVPTLRIAFSEDQISRIMPHTCLPPPGL